MDKPKIGVGVGVMIVKGNMILLGKHQDDPAKASSELQGAGKWTMPGGKLEFGESFEQGAKREVLEETGLQLHKVSVIALNNDKIETAHFITIGLYSEDFEGEVVLNEPTVFSEWKWFDLDKLPSPLYFPSKKILDNYTQKKFYITN